MSNAMSMRHRANTHAGPLKFKFMVYIVEWSPSHDFEEAFLTFKGIPSGALSVSNMRGN